MGIESTRILDEIDKHTARAREGDPAKIRESLAAIRALCDLLLEDTAQTPNKPRAMPLSTQSVSMNKPQTQAIPEATRLQEQGANGDSLFEF